MRLLVIFPQAVQVYRTYSTDTFMQPLKKSQPAIIPHKLFNFIVTDTPSNFFLSLSSTHDHI
jgi:hypothetical protein